MLLTYQWHRSPAGRPLEIRLYTNNIRFDNKNLSPGERLWESRGPLAAQSIEENAGHGPSVVCLQEVLHNQLKDILSHLNKDGQEWGYYGVGRSDGRTKGEYAPILYKKADWHLESSRTYWLSETPDKPSVGWDAALERIVTEAILKSKISGQSVKVLNTHFDHKGVVARRELVKLIISKLEAGDEPSFLCGDLNTQPTDEPYAILKKSDFRDSRTFMLNPDENEPTFTGFSDAEGTGIIDYVWADSKSHWRGYHVLPNFFGFRMSDHRPVAADFRI
ncbi:DNase I-like protein [Metschnikowia bicuspidata var. bicuspidata NRRL YB-4993]|uniref:DNase I-like protein n=1 Tax=Metschnikowia bicuspidata var. bicuspidata NRRL YB-4993 TaxID=869754 RepID=A0A1A0HGN3_9ASCO|nr:DNase I-like protein [Metschnikowia bicuspidata var. bicuspidata NRRL YB-4993]OBA23161.1 DNase I-like protein [Metschnikowia bicuspidata var. bicuspidata NRRL YB-4993]